ncbi:hypothetical protein LINGRAHAP2_LOCUS14509 [Linum grandiflorum]
MGLQLRLDCLFSLRLLQITMKWFVDDKGWPHTKSVSAEEIQGLMAQNQWNEVKNPMVELDLDDVFDESLLSDPTRPAFECIQPRCEAMNSTIISQHIPSTYMIWVYGMVLGRKII